MKSVWPWSRIELRSGINGQDDTHKEEMQDPFGKFLIGVVVIAAASV
jgi:hypothetical protein